MRTCCRFQNPDARDATTHSICSWNGKATDNYFILMTMEDVQQARVRANLGLETWQPRGPCAKKVAAAAAPIGSYRVSLSPTPSFSLAHLPCVSRPRPLSLAPSRAQALSHTSLPPNSLPETEKSPSPPMLTAAPASLLSSTWGCVREEGCQ